MVAHVMQDLPSVFPDCLLLQDFVIACCQF